jgi:ADP-heptose:LPS heptosyltransferase
VQHFGAPLISLQNQSGEGIDGVVDVSNELDDFSDTAALIANLDRVISVDTAVAHLAGAMGKPTTLLLPHVADWRWMRDREDSPWYPTMRLLRQAEPGDWDPPIDRLMRD